MEERLQTIMASAIADKINNVPMSIPVDNVDYNPEDTRKDEPVDMNLLGSLKKTKQAELGIVRAGETEGQFIIIAGNRRLKALKTIQESLREKDPNAVVKFEARLFTGDIQEARQLVAISNSFRKDFSLQQKVALVLKYQAEGMDAKDIANAFGMKNPTEVYNLINVGNSAAASELYAATEAGIIKETTAKMLAKSDEDILPKLEEAKAIAKGIQKVAKAKAKPGEKPKKVKVSAAALTGRYTTQTNLTTDDWKRLVAAPETPEQVAFTIMALVFDEPEAFKKITSWLPSDIVENEGHSINPALKAAAELEAQEQSKGLDITGGEDDEEAVEDFATAVAE